MSQKLFSPINAACVAAIALPAVLVETGYTLLGSAPAVSLASTEDQESSDAPRKPPAPLTAAQRAAIGHAVKLHQAMPGETPFRVVATVDAPEAPADPAPRSAAPVQIPSPAVTLSMIVRQRDGTARALVGGKLLNIGDEAAAGWTVAEIDAAARTVLLTSEDGQTHTVGLKRTE